MGAIGFKVVLKGSRKLARAFKALRVNGDKIIEKEGVIPALFLVEGEAKRLAPKKTGRLERSITSKITERAFGVIRGTVGVNVKYAPRLENPKNKGKQPVHRSKAGFIGKSTKFLFPALFSQRQEVFILISKATRKAIVKSRAFG